MLKVFKKKSSPLQFITIIFLINLRPKARFALEAGPPQETNAAISSPASGEALPEGPRRARAFATCSATRAPPGARRLAQAPERGGSRRRGRPGALERASLPGPQWLRRPVGTKAVRGSPREGVEQGGIGDSTYPGRNFVVLYLVRHVTYGRFSPHGLLLSGEERWSHFTQEN